MKDDIVQKYQEKFQIEMFREVDSLFPERTSKERDNALLLITVLGVKFHNLLERLLKEIEQCQQSGKKD